MNVKHLTQLRKFTRILYVCGASLLLAAMVLSMVNIPVMAADSDGDGYDDSWDPCPNDYNNTCDIVWCHCGEGHCQTIHPDINSLIKDQGNGGHIDAQGNILHAGDHSGACVVPTDDPTDIPVLPTNTPVTPTNTPTNTPVTPTSTPVTPTNTPTNTLVPPTNTPTDTPTNTLVPPTNTHTYTPGGPTLTPSDTPTNTLVPPTNTPTHTPTNTLVPPTSTPTHTPTNTLVPPTSTPVTSTLDPTATLPQDPPEDPTEGPTQDPPQDPPQDPNPPAAVLIPVTGIELQGSGILLARTLSLNLGMLFFGMAMVLQSITYRSSKKQ